MSTSTGATTPGGSINKPASYVWVSVGVGVVVVASLAVLWLGDFDVDLEKLAGVVDGSTSLILDYAAVAAAVGAVSMALVEVLKGLFFARQFFHGWMVSSWLDQFLPESSACSCRRGEAESKLLALTCGHEKNRLVWLDQPTARMFAQLQGAAHIVLAEPAGREELYFLLTGEEPPIGTDDQRSTAKLIAARRIEALQTQTEYWWTRGNQIAAMAVSFLLFQLFIGRWVEDGGANFSGRGIFIASLLGGVIAPFAKDVLTQIGSAQARRG